MMPERDLLETIKVQIRLERKTSKKIKELEDFVTNLAAKLFLAEMRFDTEKHAKILQTMLNLISQCEPDSRFWQTETHEHVDALVTKRMLKDHVKVETEMLKLVEDGIKKTDDSALKELFKHIVDDERKHHKIMETILQRAFKMINIT